MQDFRPTSCIFLYSEAESAGKGGGKGNVLACTQGIDRCPRSARPVKPARSSVEPEFEMNRVGTGFEARQTNLEGIARIGAGDDCASSKTDTTVTDKSARQLACPDERGCARATCRVIGSRVVASKWTA